MTPDWKRALQNIAQRVKKKDPQNPVVEAIEHELDARHDLRDRDEAEAAGDNVEDPRPRLERKRVPV